MFAEVKVTSGKSLELYMIKRFIFYFKYIIFWLSILILFRIIFLFYHFNKAEVFTIKDIILSNWHGLRLDVSLLGYFLIIIHVFLVTGSLLKSNYLINAINVYTFPLLILIILLNIIDLELYNYWGFRLDNTFLDYIKTPKEMLASLVIGQVFILIIAVAVLFYVIKKYYYDRWVISTLKVNIKRNWWSSVIFLVLIPLLLLPIRGGIDTAPVNTGTVYYHHDQFYNHAAINPVWNLIYGFTEKEKLEHSVHFFDDDSVEHIMDQLYIDSVTTLKVVDAVYPNIILIILESFSGLYINKQEEGKEITPNFNKYIHEGIYFNNIYASGTLSDRGLSAILSGYPALPKATIIHFENKTQDIPGISKSLEKEGYSSTFFYGGDIDFAHIKSYLMNTGFSNIIEECDLPSTYLKNKWGIHDHYMFDVLFNHSDTTNYPFFHTLFTLSSHEPFDVPMDPVFSNKTRQLKFCNSIFYADSCLGVFIEKAKKANWWDNTLIIITADHGSRNGDITYCEKDRFYIPMLWMGGVITEKDTIINTLCSQTDISKTLLNQLNFNTTAYNFSNDILNKDYYPFAYYSCQNGFGFITDSCYYTFDLASNDFIDKPVKATDNSVLYGKAYLQNLLNDFATR